VVWTCTTAPSVTYRYVGTATITVSGGGGGGSAELPAGGVAGSLLQRVGTTGAGWMARNTASGYAGVEVGGSIPENIVPGTIARDTEVTAAISAAFEQPIDGGTFT
jgi:hypothetical protein